jgi:WD40 repeat protein
VAAWRDDGVLLAAADSEDNVNLWDAATGELRGTYGGHGQPVTELDWQPGGALLAVRGGDEVHNLDPSVRIWDTRRPPGEALLHRLRLVQPWKPQGMMWDPQGNSLAVEYCQPAFYIWPIRSFGPPKRYLYKDKDTVDLCGMLFSRDGERVAISYRYAGGGDGLLIYDVNSAEIQVERFGKVGAFRLWTPENRLMLMRFYSDVYRSPLHVEPEVKIEGYPQFQRILPGLTDVPIIGALSASGQYAAAATKSGEGLAWDIETGRVLFMLTDAVELVWSPDETSLAVRRSDSAVWVVDMSGRIIHNLPAVGYALSPYLYNVQPAAKLVWSPDGQTLAHLHDGVIDLWRFDD